MKRNGGLSQTLLPDELMGEILLRLPVRSLLRFKCVCKSWLSLISDPQFAESQFDLGAAATHRVIRLINDFQVTSIDADDDSSAAVVINTPVPERARPRFAIIGGSCRGFLLLELLSYVDFFDLVVWNPSTGLQRRVHGINMLDWYPHLCGIGYDPSTDDYVVVVVILPRFATRHLQPYTVVNCFSLRANSWSFTQSYNLMYIDHDPEFSQGEFLNGALHWLVRSEDELRVIIVAFDVREKKLLEIPLPRDLAAAAQSESESETYLIYHLTSMGGCLCFCLQRNRNNGTIVHEMWTMKEYKVHSSWTKSFFPSTSSNHRLHLKYPICFTKNGEILALNGCVRLVRIDDKGEYRPHGKHVSSLGINQHGIYTETLLSLPGDDFDKLSQ